MQPNCPPFTPRGGATSTVNLAVGVAAASLVVPRLPANGGEIRISNIGTQTVFVAFSGTATLGTSMPLQSNTFEIFSCPDNTTLSAIAAATGSTMYVTAGEGI